MPDPRARPPRWRRVVRRPAMPWPLALLLAVAALQGLAWAIVIPPFQGPDEPEHIAYAQHLAETGRPVERAVEGPGYSTEISAALNELNLRATQANPNAKPSFNEVDLRAWEIYTRERPDAHREDGVGPNAQAQNPPLFYALQVVPYRLAFGGDLLDRIFAMRLVTVALYVGTVWLVWLLAAALFGPGRTWPRVVAAGVVALHPKFASLAGTVNPDVLLAFLWTAFALVAVRALREGLTVRRVALLGGLTAASALTHGRGLPLVLAALVVGALLLERWRPPWRTVARLGALGAGIVVVGVLCAALWSASATGEGAFGGEVTQSAGDPNLRGFLSYVWQFYFPSFSFLETRLGPPYGFRQMFVDTFFSGLATLEVTYQPRTLDLFQIAAIAGLALVWSQALWFRDRIARHWRELVALASIPFALLLALHLSAYRDMLVNPADPLITGRYLIPLVALFGLACAFACLHLPRRAGPVAGALLLGVGAVVQLTSMGLTLERFYA
jgi:4-amino-4-deoxy-L-arabinose transferase-like glycosyltransferase